MSRKRIVIIAYDAISPLGTDMKTQWKRAVDGKSGIGELTRFPLKKDFPVRVAGQVDEIDTAAYSFLKPRALAHWTSPIFKYGMLSVYHALEKIGLEITRDISPRVAVTFSSAIGGQDAVVEADRRMISENRLPPPFTNPNSCINMIGGKISILTKATGPITSTITACATGVTSMIVGTMLLEQGKADAAICGAVDFPLIEPIVAGFATMNGAYSCWENQPVPPPENVSRPFSLNRKGFVVSEGVGSIVIATKEFADAMGLGYEIEISGWSMTSDAHHFVAPNLETVTRCIDECILDAGISTTDIDAVNAHGTSTRIGDKIEFEALKNVFGKDIPPVTANKSLTGHAMGASSAIESVLAMEGMRKDVLLPTLNHIPDPEIVFDNLPTKAENLQQEFVLKNSFGFGGCNSCMVFRRLE